ncbi:MAG: hypothetical protein V4530_08075 [Pseudomonadota bacterium]
MKLSDTKPTDDARTYMVMGADAAGDMHLFATDNLARATETYNDMLVRLTEVRANWVAESGPAREH